MGKSWSHITVCQVVSLVLASVSVVGLTTRWSASAAGATGPAHAPLQYRYPIRHVVIIVKENRSFDDLFGRFPGANGATTGVLSTGKTVPLGHMPDHFLFDLGHDADAACLAVNAGRMNGFDLLTGAMQSGHDLALSQYRRSVFGSSTMSFVQLMATSFLLHFADQAETMYMCVGKLHDAAGENMRS